jgi:hypothetical protein
MKKAIFLSQSSIGLRNIGGIGYQKRPKNVKKLNVMSNKSSNKEISNYDMLGIKLLYGLFLIVTLQMILIQNAFAYLDPGTGSYIFQVLIAAIIGGLFTIKIYWQKIKDFFINHFSRKQGK